MQSLSVRARSPRKHSGSMPRHRTAPPAHWLRTPFWNPNRSKRRANSDVRLTPPSARALSMRTLHAPLPLSFRGSPSPDPGCPPRSGLWENASPPLHPPDLANRPPCPDGRTPDSCLSCQPLLLLSGYAAHYHELAMLSDRLDRLSNANVAVREWESDVIFLGELAERSSSVFVGCGNRARTQTI